MVPVIPNVLPLAPSESKMEKDQSYVDSFQSLFVGLDSESVGTSGHRLWRRAQRGCQSGSFFYGRGRNFVIGEAHHLPFKDETFTKVYSKHCLEHLESPLVFFREAKRTLKKGGILECIYPTDTMLTKKTIHNLLALHWSSAFKWKRKVTGTDKINYGGHKWQLPDCRVLKLLQKAGFAEVAFEKISFPTIRMDSDLKKKDGRYSSINIFLNGK